MSLAIWFLFYMAAAYAGTTWFTDTTAVLAGSATFTGTTRDSGASPPSFTNFGCTFNADQSGTAFVDTSVDGTNWLVGSTAAIVANTPLDLSVKMRTRYYRCRETNGSTIQTVNRVVSSFTT